MTQLDTTRFATTRFATTRLDTTQDDVLHLVAGTFSFAHEMVREQALTDPDAPAVVDTDGAVTAYGELVALSDRLAARLCAAGVGPETPVAVQLRRSADLVVALLATLVSGGAYVPLDDAAPARRSAAQIRHLGVPVLVTDRDPEPEVLETGVRVLPPTGNGGAAVPVTGPFEDGLAYVLHTSGSTGTPKGVAMPHRGLTRLLRWQLAAGEPGLATALFTSAGFDVTFQEVLSTLASGGRLCLVPHEARRDPEQLLALLDDRGVERIFLPYVALHELAGAAQRTGRVPGALRHVVTAGEQLVLTDPIRALFDALPGCRLDNHYGPTETHLATSWTVTDPGSADRTVAPIGAAVTGAEVHLLDEQLRPAAPGAVGELYVGGAAVARGYAGAPGATAGRFLPDPWAVEPGARMYRTGDLARVDDDGLLRFLHRNDAQLKVHGYRVEPAEVEYVLSAHPGVRGVAVGLRAVGEQTSCLVAHVVPEEPPPAPAELAAHTRAALPPYMVPVRFVVVEELPLTPSGKVDRAALAAAPALPVDELAVPTGSSVADAVTAVWTRVLGYDEFEPDDDFFDVGGDSVLAAWVVTELGQVLGRPVALSLLLECGTVEELAAALSADVEGPVADRRRSEVVTLSAGRANRALFLLHALGGEVLGYREVARAMESPLRVLGVRWAGDADAMTSIEEVARAHVEQIRLVQPEGPYLLAGWSFGGVLAYEVAAQLTAAGHEVGYLGLLDANPLWDPITGLRPADAGYLPMLDRVLDGIEDAGGRGVDVSSFADDPAWRGIMGDTSGTDVGVAHLAGFLARARAGMRALVAYRPAPYGGRIDLYQAVAADAGVRTRLAAALRELTGGRVRARAVRGDHSGMLRGAEAVSLAASIDHDLAPARDGETPGEGEGA